MNKLFEIKTIGDEILKKEAKKVSKNEIENKKMRIFAQILVAKMRELDGVGIAAPQIGVSKRVIAIEVNNSDRYPDREPFELTVMINPTYSRKSKVKIEDYEGCLSVPGLRAMVPRYKEISIGYTDLDGNEQMRVLEGFTARIFQHEYDHLEGMVYLDRVENIRSIMTEENYKSYVLTIRKLEKKSRCIINKFNSQIVNEIILLIEDEVTIKNCKAQLDNEALNLSEKKKVIIISNKYSMSDVIESLSKGKDVFLSKIESNLRIYKYFYDDCYIKIQYNPKRRKITFFYR